MSCECSGAALTCCPDKNYVQDKVCSPWSGTVVATAITNVLYNNNINQNVIGTGFVRYDVGPAAMNLIHHLTNPFEQEMYTDEYKEALTELIENKIEQQEKTETISPAPNIINIMETLQASIEQAKIKRDNKTEKEAK